jgi:pimeloyl-ACP methyl ester carboxylesterase
MFSILSAQHLQTIELRRQRPPRWLLAGSPWAGALASVMLAVSTVSAAAPPAEKPVQEETVRLPGPIEGLKLGLRHASTMSVDARQARPAVLFLHGSAVPVSGNPDFRQGGQSFMTALAERGFDVWALDFYGFGESDRYPEMQDPPDKHPPLGAARECADQVQSVVAFLKRERHFKKIMLIGDSGGSLVAGLFATEHPDSVSRLILFAPITPFTDTPSPQGVLPAYEFVTPQTLWSLLKNWSDAAGTPDVLDSSAYQAWADIYLRSDATSGTRNPPSVKIPNGREADLAAIARGQFTFDPSEIRAPTLIVMGEWDTVATFQGAEWLLKSLKQAASQRLIVLGRGSHTIQFESERGRLYGIAADFLGEKE